MKRFLFSNNGTLKDYSANLVDYHTGSAVIDFTKDDDAIYIGSQFPFNSLYFDMKVVNDITSGMKISHWDNSSWKDMAEVIDETNGLFNSGHVTWVPNKNDSWTMDDTIAQNGGESITGLGSVIIYDLYWLKITFAESINPLTEINWIGPKFCSDADLVGEYTLFGNNTFRSNYESGKIDWEKEIILASRLLIDDIEKKGAILSGDQLLIRRKLLDSCVSKTSQVIFKNLGDDYKDDTEKSKIEYYERLDKSNYGADRNNNAILEPSERKAVSGVLYK